MSSTKIKYPQRPTMASIKTILHSIITPMFTKDSQIKTTLFAVLASVAQLIGASPHLPKGCGFNSQSGHISRLWV